MGYSEREQEHRAVVSHREARHGLADLGVHHVSQLIPRPVALDLERRDLDAEVPLETFFGLRATPKLRKKPSTSELIDWILALKKSGVDLAKVGHGIPFLGTLLKNESDVELVQKRAKA